MFQKISNSSLRSQAATLLFNKYQIVQAIGKGAFGIVTKAIHKQNNIVYAVKHLSANNNPSEEKIIRRQVNLLKKIKHPNIIKLEEVIRADKEPDIFLIFQYVQTDLSKSIKNSWIQQDQKINIFKQIVQGVAYLHHVGIIHRDIKPSNILIDDNLNVKICDFGLAKSIQPDKIHEIHTENIGTRSYRSPQILFGSHKYTLASDIWSLGCLFYELFMNCPLFQSRNAIDQMKQILQLKGLPNDDEKADLNIGQNGLIENLFFLSFHRKSASFYWKQNINSKIINLFNKMMEYSPSKRIKPNHIIKYIQQIEKQPQQIKKTNNLCLQSNISMITTKFPKILNQQNFLTKQNNKQKCILKKALFRKEKTNNALFLNFNKSCPVSKQNKKDTIQKIKLIKKNYYEDDYQKKLKDSIKKQVYSSLQPKNFGKINKKEKQIFLNSTSNNQLKMFSIQKNIALKKEMKKQRLQRKTFGEFLNVKSSCNTKIMVLAGCISRKQSVDKQGKNSKFSKIQKINFRYF